MKIEELFQKSEEMEIHLSDDMLHQFDVYADLLIEWNEKMNLTAITEKEEIIEKHFYDCLLPLSMYSEEIQGSCADIGSGAGFPGMVWAIVRPDIQMTLIEPTGKRCTFLKVVIDTLGLKNVEVINERAEDCIKGHRESYDAVTARAVANLNLLSELCIPFVKKNGFFIAMKGRKGKEEDSAASIAVKKLGAVLKDSQEVSLSQGDDRVILCYKKIASTPIEYPRNYGQMKKRPL